MSGALTAKSHATQLLQPLGLCVCDAALPPDEHPALGWARSGLMALTGRAGGEPLMCPVPLTTCADGALAALASLAPEGAYTGLRGRDLLAERAAIFGHARQGAASPGGSSRLLEAADGWCVLNLARDEDWALLPALLEGGHASDWPTLQAAVRSLDAGTLVARARELGLAAARADETVKPGPWFRRRHDTQASAPARTPRVLDLSTLWAGPLCAHLLQRAGAQVIKCESLQRPDGARRGPSAFFELMNAGKRSVALDLANAAGREQLRALLAAADIVIESARPRGLRQLGLRAEDFLEQKPGQVWIAISGYGRGEPQENWIAYGDDAAVAAGLTQQLFAASGERVFVGDAIADPLTGLHAALCAWSAWSAGAGGLYALALRDVVAQCMQADAAGDLRSRQREWTRIANDAGVAAPVARKIPGAAAALGADTRAVFAEFGISP